MSFENSPIVPNESGAEENEEKIICEKCGGDHITEHHDIYAAESDAAITGALLKNAGRAIKEGAKEMFVEPAKDFGRTVKEAIKEKQFSKKAEQTMTEEQKKASKERERESE